MTDLTSDSVDFSSELQAVREQQRALGDVLRAVARGEGLEPVLAEVIEAAARLCGGEYGVISLVEGEGLHAIAHWGSPELLEHDRGRIHTRDRATAIGRVSLDRRPVQIPDVLADPEYFWPAQQELGYRAVLGVPVLLDEELIGAMAIMRDCPGPYDQQHVELVKTFADQAAIAIANARLIETIERQLEQQRAVSDVLRAIALSEGLQEVFQAVVESATRLCRADFGGLHVADGDVFRLSTRQNLAPALDDFESEHPQVGDRRTAVGRVILTRDVVHIADVEVDPEYDWGGTDAVEYHALAAPVLVDDELIGVIDAVRRAREPFAEEEVRLIRAFADQAAIAIRNARLLETVQRQLEQQRAVSNVLGAVARREGLQPVLDEVVEQATKLSGSENGRLWLVENGAMHAFANFGSTEGYEYEREHPISPDRTTMTGRVALTREVVHIPDVSLDPDYAYAGPTPYRAGLTVPILLEEELIGAIGVVRPEAGPFADEQIELVKIFADQAAIAIANARLLDAVERQKAELSRFVSPQVAELLSSDRAEQMLAGHRAYVTILFCDLRGFTAFTQTAEPEELFEVLRDYHTAVGELIPQYGGTLEHFQGDGLMVFFNDPVPVEDHELNAVRLAVAAQERIHALAEGWRKRGTDLTLGIGVAAGYATLGRIGFEGRYDYGALGSVTNLASRLTSHAQPGQTLISQRVFAAVEEKVEAEPLAELELKGFREPVAAYEVRGLR